MGRWGVGDGLGSGQGSGGTTGDGGNGTPVKSRSPVVGYVVNRCALFSLSVPGSPPVPVEQPARRSEWAW